MDIPVESWYNAIFRRYSNRQYNGKPVEDELLTRLEKVSDEFRPFQGVRSQVVREPEHDVFKGLIGTFGKVIGAVHYIAFIKNPTLISESVIGYMGEGIILEATALGLNTCWVTGGIQT
jgi:nitroreductase